MVRLVEGGIARKLIIFIVLFSSAITILSTAVQLYFDYDNELSGIERKFDQIKQSYLQSVAATLWVADASQLQVMLDGIRQLPDLTRVEVTGPDGTVIAQSGEDANGDVLSRTFPLSYLHREDIRRIGHLTVTASLDGIYQRLLDRVLIILVSNGVKTFFVAIFIFFVFSYMVTRHLGAMADYARRLTPGRLDQTLVLDRRARLDKGRAQDELHDLAEAINEMRERLRGSYRALEENEERFRQLAENIQEVFWIGSTDWRHVFYISPLYEEVWGRPVDELYRNAGAWMDSVHKDDREMVRDAVAQKVATDCADPLFPDYRIVRPDGETRWVRARAFPVRDKDGVSFRIAGIAEDITLKRNAEQALRENERRYRSIVETTAEGYWLADAEGRTLEVNDALCRMLGYDRDEFLDRLPLDFIADHAKDDFCAYFSERRGERHRSYETVYRAKDGREVDAKISASSLFGGEGELLGSFAFITDITEQKRADAELRKMHGELEHRVVERTRELQEARNRAVAADRAKSEFLANMSHELRTPLNAVIGFSDVMLQKVFGEVANTRYEEYVRLINESGIHLLDLISDLLDVSAIEAGRMDMVEEDVDLADVVESCLRLIYDRAAKAGVRVDTDTAAELPPVRADSRRMKQILINLMTNAVKFTPEGGRITVGTGRADDGGVVVHVTDTGMGMSADECRAVLMPFTRTQAATEGHYEGTGLGLPLVKGLVEAHGGRLTLESNPGAGTTATVWLPSDRVSGAVSA